MDYMDVIRLSMFQDHYKAKSKVNMSATEARNIRINKKAMERKSRRMDDFAANRSMSDRQRADIKQASAAPKPDLRKLQMQQWKEEKLKKKLMEPKKPPPFKVGVVTHPFVPFRAEKSCKHAKSPQVCLRMTRSATRALQNGVKADNQSVPTKSFAPPNSKFHAPVIIKTKTKYTPKKVYKTKMFSGILSHTPKKVGEISLSRKNNNTANLKNTILNEKKITISKLHKKKELNAETVVPARRRSLRKKTITIELDRPLEEELDNKPTNTENLKDSSSKTKKRLSKKSLQFDDIEKQNHTEIYNENDKMNESNITTPLKEEKNRRSSKRNSVKIEHLQELSDSPMKKMTPKINKTPKITLNNSFATPYAVSCVNEESPSLILKNQNLIVMSPLVTVSRGKGNSKRESAKRISFGNYSKSSFILV